MSQPELIPHLFRTEYRKIVSVLCKLLGVQNLEAAEDITSDTFLLATETWGQKGLPENPSAWLYKVAKNKALNYLKRENHFKNSISKEILNSISNENEFEIDLSPKNIEDSQLQMMFTICNPVISVEGQIGLSLRILCGFGIDEIAEAFLTNKETINKRLFRAKEKLREINVKIEIPEAKNIHERLEVVLTTLYLLFSEGYYSSGSDKILRKDLCLEAIRLNFLLVENKLTNTPNCNALLSLMCFHASRFDARINELGENVLYDNQNRELWDHELISRGEFYLNQSATGNKLSKYHLEAAIAYWHTTKVDSKEKWENILQLYNQLLQISYSPIAALNRTYALFRARNVEDAIIEAEKLKLEDNHFYYTLLGELYSHSDKAKANTHFEKALNLAKNIHDKKSIQNKMRGLFPFLK